MSARIGVAALAIALVPAQALDPARKLHHYSQRQWLDADGLPQNTVLAIEQTPDGYLWAATEGGLVRFNGRRFQVFDRSNTSQLQTNSITALSAAADGGLWVGTRRGLLRERDGRLEAPFAGSKLGGLHIRFLFRDGEGILWAGTSAGLARIVNGKATYPLPAPVNAQDRVRSFFKRGGEAWVGTIHGLGALIGNSIQPAGGIPRDTVRAIVRDRSGRLWIGTEHRGLYSIEGTRVRRYSSRAGLGSDSVRALIEDHDGNLWIGTIGGGLRRYRDGRFEGLTTADGLASNHVRSLFEDREGNLWVGLEGGGLLQLRNGRVLTLTRRDGLGSDFIRAVHGDAGGNLLIGTEGEGLFRYRGDRVERVNGLGMERGFVTALHQDRRGSLWVGTEGGGAVSIGPEGRRTYSTATGIAENSAWAIAEDTAGAIWIGTSQGLLRVFRGGRRLFTTGDGLASNAIRSLAAARDGSLWVAYRGGGLDRLAGDSVSRPDVPPEFRKVIVTSMYEDAGGAMWVTSNGGLFHFRDGRTSMLTVRHGLFSDVLYQVLDGGDGTLWFASSKGIFAARQAELEAVIAGRRPRAGVTSFTTADGMASSECSNDAQPAGWKTADGSLWFSTIRGVVGIRPHELRPNRNAPPVRIEEIEVNGQPAPISREISLPAGSRLLTIRFAGLSYSAPEKVRYQCRLAGADPDWVETPGPAVTYHNLPPGRYTFAVRTANEEGAWSEAPAAIAITAEAYFTQTPWFYGLCLAALAGCTVLLLRMRGRAADQRFAAVLAERTRIAREIHDTLLQGFAGAALQLNAMSKYVQADPARAGVEIERVLDQIDGCLADARSEIVTLRQSGRDEETFVTRLRHTVEAAAGSGMLQVRFEAAGEPRPLPAEVERNLLRIAGEAVSNAARHARANMVTVRLEYHPVSVHLAAVDDGSGLSAAPAAASHFGLTGMRERTELMGGRFTIESHEGRGTGIDVRIPLRDAV